MRKIYLIVIALVLISNPLHSCDAAQPQAGHLLSDVLTKMQRLEELAEPEECSNDQLPTEQLAKIKIQGLEELVPPEPYSMDFSSNSGPTDEYERILAKDEAILAERQKKSEEWATRRREVMKDYSMPVVPRIDQATLNRIKDRNHKYVTLDTYDYIGDSCYLVSHSYTLKLPRRYQASVNPRVVDIYHEVEILNAGILPSKIQMLDCELPLRDLETNEVKWYRFRAFTMRHFELGEIFAYIPEYGKGVTSIIVEPREAIIYIKFTDQTYKRAYVYLL
ncbi:hypothetical protein LJC40_06485 [Synergistaceae bacterium OttesenSCG-928-D05]|nr:hypothetical protein [Synergistaceae bacterium OttesenSCG-928-D05]